MDVVEEFLKANEEFAASFRKSDLPVPPGRKAAIVVCMDARIDPARVLGLKEGDAHVIRNAGGRLTDDALRSLVISQQLLGTNTIVVIHHTDCGMLTFTNEQLRHKIKQELHADADGIDFLPSSDLKQSLLEDVATIKGSPLIPKTISVYGFIYDVHNGKLEAVVTP